MQTGGSDPFLSDGILRDTFEKQGVKKLCSSAFLVLSDSGEFFHTSLLLQDFSSVISKPCYLSSPHLISPSSAFCDSFHPLLPHKQQRIRVLFINCCLEEVRVISYYPVEEVQA